MSDGPGTSRKRSGRKADMETVLRFIDDFAWLLENYSDLDFRALQSVRNELVHAPPLFQKFAPRNPNVVYLVGTLPGLFMDEKIFSNNEDIAEFSDLVLNIKIPRWQKKAKFELVGHIVCHAFNLNDGQVSKLTAALTRIVDGEVGARKMLEDRKEQGLSWNEVIQNLIARQ